MWRALPAVAMLVLGCSRCGGTGASAPVQPAPAEPGARPLVLDEELPFGLERLQPLHAPVPAPEPGDWLAEHPEPAQSFAAFTASNPVRPRGGWTTIYVLPLGEFTPAQLRVLEKTVDFVGRWYQLPVRTLEALPASAIPEKARRVHPKWGGRQVLTTWVLEELLMPRRPKDAVALLALTAEDLYPDPAWNFVFGQANIEDRVGVWSFHRFGDPERDAKRYLLRAMKLAVHELGHVFGLHHCQAWHCAMNGSNSLPETDRSPVHPCPVCLAKLQWNVGFDGEKRLAELEAFFLAEGFEAELTYTRQARRALGAPGADR